MPQSSLSSLPIENRDCSAIFFPSKKKKTPNKVERVLLSFKAISVLFLDNCFGPYQLYKVMCLWNSIPGTGSNPIWTDQGNEVPCHPAS